MSGTTWQTVAGKPKRHVKKGTYIPLHWFTYYSQVRVCQFIIHQQMMVEIVIDGTTEVSSDLQASAYCASS
jgi:hypothetical protein